MSENGEQRRTTKERDLRQARRDSNGAVDDSRAVGSGVFVHTIQTTAKERGLELGSSFVGRANPPINDPSLDSRRVGEDDAAENDLDDDDEKEEGDDFRMNGKNELDDKVLIDSSLLENF